jgi:hypothetical protein
VTWFGNNVTKKDSTEAPKAAHGKQLTLRDVIKATHKDQIYALVNEKSKAAPGQSEWLRFYPRVLTEYVEGLTPAEVQEAEKVLEEWNDNGIPREVQQQ